MKEVILTPEGYEKLKQEIDYLQNEKRREVAERIRVAREFGDIAENAEYDDAKNEQAMLEHKIAQLEERLLSARVITKKEISKDTVSVGSKVRLRDVAANKTFEYHIVGSAEANPAENKLSNESPVGKAIIGHKKGDVVEVTAPRGALKFKILEIKAEPGLGQLRTRRATFRVGARSDGRPRSGRTSSTRRAPCSRARSRTTRRGRGCSPTRSAARRSCRGSSGRGSRR